MCPPGSERHLAARGCPPKSPIFGVRQLCVFSLSFSDMGLGLFFVVVVSIFLIFFLKEEGPVHLY